MAEYLPSQITDAVLAAYYTPQETAHGTYYRANQPMQGYPNGFYASERTAAAQPPAPPRIHLSVAVYVGRPRDYQKARHAVLCFRPDNRGQPMVAHLFGPKKNYTCQTRDNYDPTTSLNFAKEIPVGWITTPMTKQQLAGFVYHTPIDNKIDDFDCQKWVAAALQRLATAGYVTEEQCRDGINGMVDATMDAIDEPE